MIAKGPGYGIHFGFRRQSLELGEEPVGSPVLGLAN